MATVVIIRDLVQDLRGTYKPVSGRFVTAQMCEEICQKVFMLMEQGRLRCLFDVTRGQYSPHWTFNNIRKIYQTTEDYEWCQSVGLIDQQPAEKQVVINAIVQRILYRGQDGRILIARIVE